MATEITEGGQRNADLMANADPSDTSGFASDFVDHDPAEGQPAGGEGLAWYWKGFGDSFSDVDFDLLETIVTPEHHVIVADVSGTHTGDYLGHAATGRRFTVRNVQVMKIVDGVRTERWGSTDQLGILQQLGLLD